MNWKDWVKSWENLPNCKKVVKNSGGSPGSKKKKGTSGERKGFFLLIKRQD